MAGTPERHAARQRAELVYVRQGRASLDYADAVEDAQDVLVNALGRDGWDAAFVPGLGTVFTRTSPDGAQERLVFSLVSQHRFAPELPF